jgi:hypothetical protein
MIHNYEVWVDGFCVNITRLYLSVTQWCTATQDTLGTDLIFAGACFIC